MMASKVTTNSMFVWQKQYYCFNQENNTLEERTLNLFQRILRKLLGFYANTHLGYVAHNAQKFILTCPEARTMSLEQKTLFLDIITKAKKQTVFDYVNLQQKTYSLIGKVEILSEGEYAYTFVINFGRRRIVVPLEITDGTDEICIGPMLFEEKSREYGYGFMIDENDALARITFVFLANVLIRSSGKQSIKFPKDATRHGGDFLPRKYGFEGEQVGRVFTQEGHQLRDPSGLTLTREKAEELLKRELYPPQKGLSLPRLFPEPGLYL